jgi:hypothetical protein
VVSKVDELSSVASDLDPDLILLTESWCSDQITNAYLTFSGYELITDLRKDRYYTDRGRSLLVYAKNNLNVSILPSDDSDDKFQYCKFKVSDVTFYLIYRSPSGGLDTISGLAGLLRRADKNCFLVGDFNVPDWANGAAGRRSRELLEAANDRLLEQLVAFPTHIRGNTLDLVLTDMPERVSDVRDEGRLGSSDHVTVMSRIVIKPEQRPDQRPLPDWNRAVLTSIRCALRRDNWDEKLRGLTTDEALDQLRNRLHGLIEKHVPARRRRNHNRPPWLSRDILRAIRRKKRLWRHAKQGQKVEEYREAEKQVKNMIRNAKRKFERDIAKGCGSKRVNKRQFFSYIKQRTKSRTGIGPLKDGHGKTVQDDQDMAELLNGFFSGIFTREDTTNIPKPQPTGCRWELRGLNITERDVKAKIRKLRADEAAGQDRLGPLLPKKLADELAAPLAIVMRTSLREGSVTDSIAADIVTKA